MLGSIAHIHKISEMVSYKRMQIPEDSSRNITIARIPALQVFIEEKLIQLGGHQYMFFTCIDITKTNLEKGASK